MEVVNQTAANDCNVIWHPHPVLPGADRKSHQCVIKQGSTVREVLISAGIDTKQPIFINLDDRLLTIEEWDLICPTPGQIINVQATVMGGGGGGGGSNPLQVVALVAIVVLSVYTAGAVGAAYGAAWGAAAGAAVSIAGSMIVNAVFAATNPSTSMSNQSGTYAAGSPTYNLSGGSNRSRPYESMPVIFGVNKFFPDLSSKPFLEYQGEDQYLYQIFNLGLSNALFSDWKIGTTLVSSYQNVTWNYPDGNGKIGAFPGNVDSIPGGELTNAIGWVSRTSSSNTYRLGIDIEGVLYYANQSGGLDNTSVQLRIQYRPINTSTWLDPSSIVTQGSGFVSGHYENYDFLVEQGEWSYDYSSDGNIWVDTSYYETRTRYVTGAGNVVIVSGSTQTPRRATLFIDVPNGAYEVRVVRDTADSTDARLQNKTSWSTLRSYQRDTANYIGQNRLGLTIRASAQLNGTISQLSATVSSFATYWNGSSWVSGATSNPAHWFMDFAKGRRDTSGRLLYGIGLADSQIDLSALSAWAIFCAQENLTFNAVIDGQQTAADILSSIGRCGFASPTWASGKLGVLWDARNASPVAAFGMSNIIRNSFQVSYITEQLAEEIVVRYVNPDKDWVQDEVRVLVPGVVTPSRSSTIDLLGCTSTSMAGKFANYFAAQQYYRTRRIQWDCDFEGFVCQRGDVVLLSHDLTQWGYSGRLVSISGNTLVLDRTVPRSGSVEHLMLKLPNGTMTTYKVTAGTTDSDTLILATQPTLQDGVDLMDHIWLFSPLPTPGKKVKILSVQPSSESLVTVIATDEDPAFYAAWDGTWQSASSNTLLKSNLPVINNLKISEHLAIVGTGQIVTRVTISWDQLPGQVERVELRCRINGGAWQSKTAYNAKSLDIDFDGAGFVEATALPINGVYVGQQIFTSAQVYGKMLPPQDVQAFSIDERASNFTLTWQKVSDLDLAGYKIRWINGDSRDWGSANPIHDGLLLSSPYISSVRPTGFGTLMIKSFDTSGNESVNPAAIVINLGDALVNNVIETIDIGALGFVGNITNGSIIGGQVVANEQGIEWNPNDTANMWHLDSGAMWRPQTYYEMSYEASVAVPVVVSGSQLTLPAVVSADSWKIEYRRLGPTRMWTTDAESMWNNDAALIWNIPNYLPWPGSVLASIDTYQFKITTSFGATQGKISSVIASFDVPDVTENLSGISISASGTRLPITKNYYSIKTVNLTLMADSSSTFIAKVIDKNPSLGPLIQCFDASNSPIAGTVDAAIQGY